MSRFGLLAIIVCLMILSGIGGNIIAYGQCKSEASVSTWVEWYGPYNACDRYVQHVVESEIVGGGYGTIKTIFHADGQNYEREHEGGNYDLGPVVITWWQDSPVTSKNNHSIMMDMQTGGLKDRGFDPGNTTYTVRYYASQQQ